MSIKIDKGKIKDALRILRSPDESIPMWSHLTSKVQGGIFITPDGYLAAVAQRGWTNTGSEATLHIGNLEYGTYEWKARIVNPTANRKLYVGLSEKAPGCYEAGLIFMQCNAGTYQTESRHEGTSTLTNLTGQDWTVERTFKVAFSSTSIQYYVDGALVATHTTNIPLPTNLHIIFIEAWQLATADATDGEVYAKGWRKIA